MGKVLYRYELEYTSEDGPTNVDLREIPVLQETDKTYLVQNRYWQKKRVRKDTPNAYAHATKEAALDHFKRRQANRIRWYEFYQRECERGLEIAEELGNDQTSQN